MVFRITEAVKRLGVCAETLRNYERRGLIKVRRDWSGRRVFTDEDLREIEERIFPEKKDGD
jgi:DNA-binding transcriptional MerR regulator